MKSVLVTGASGPVGNAIASQFHKRGFQIKRCGRNLPDAWVLGALLEPKILSGTTAVIHTAWDFSTDSRYAYPINVGGTKRIAKQCRDAGVKFIFISSLSAGASASGYGKQKRDAENAVIEEGGQILRIGLFWCAPPAGLVGDLLSISNKFPLIPFPKIDFPHIRLVEANGLVDSIELSIEDPTRTRVVACTRDATTFESLLRSGLKGNRKLIPVNLDLVRNLLRVVGLVSTVSRRGADSLLTLGQGFQEVWLPQDWVFDDAGMVEEVLYSATDNNGSYKT